MLRRTSRGQQVTVSVNTTVLAELILTVLALGALPVTYADSRQEPQALGSAAKSTQPINVIFDTDIWSDIDDMLALAMLHALQDRGEVKS